MKLNISTNMKVLTSPCKTKKKKQSFSSICNNTVARRSISVYLTFNKYTERISLQFILMDSQKKI